jgi:DNA-binding transcriptional LysR family regulator
MARRHPRLQIHACYSDRFVDLIAEGYDCAIRIGTLEDSNLIAKRIGALFGKFVASPEYIEAHGSPETPEQLLAHEALMQGNEPWQFMDGDKIVTVRPQGRFKADNGAALVSTCALFESLLNPATCSAAAACACRRRFQASRRARRERGRSSTVREITTAGTPLRVRRKAASTRGYP